MHRRSSNTLRLLARLRHHASNFFTATTTAVVCTVSGAVERPLCVRSLWWGHMQRQKCIPFTAQMTRVWDNGTPFTNAYAQTHGPDGQGTTTKESYTSFMKRSHLSAVCCRNVLRKWRKNTQGSHFCSCSNHQKRGGQL